MDLEEEQQPMSYSESVIASPPLHPQPEITALQNTPRAQAAAVTAQSVRAPKRVVPADSESVRAPKRVVPADSESARALIPAIASSSVESTSGAVVLQASLSDRVSSAAAVTAQSVRAPNA